MRILIAEDDEHIAQILKTTLEMLGRYQVTHVDNGVKAYQAAKTFCHDLLLFDDMMPGEWGQEVCRKLRSENDQRPILILSAKPVNVENCSATGFIEKPFDPQNIFKVVKSHLESQCSG